MLRIILATAGLALVAPPATAQMNPAAIGQGLVMPAAINAQAKRQSSRASSRDESAEQVCRDLPNRRARLGAGDSRIRKLTTLCRQANMSNGD